MENEKYKNFFGYRRFIEKYHRNIPSKCRLRDLLRARKDTENSVELLLDSIAQD